MWRCGEAGLKRWRGSFDFPGRLLRNPHLRRGLHSFGVPGWGQELDAPFSELAAVVVAAEMVDEHLLEGFVVGDEDVAGGASADEMAYLFSQILGMIASALQGLGHEDDLQASLVGNVLRVFNVAEKDEVSQAVHLRICAQDLDGLGYVALRECMSAVGEHLF
jgi:hypothetical protein